MAKLLEGVLPKQGKEYNQGQMNQLVKALEKALDKNINTKDGAEEQEAIDFFLYGGRG